MPSFRFSSRRTAAWLAISILALIVGVYYLSHYIEKTSTGQLVRGPETKASSASTERSLSDALPEGDGKDAIRDAFLSVENMPDDAQRSALLVELLLRCAHTDPRGSLDLILSLRDQKIRDFSATFILRNWSGREPQAALAWAETHPRAPGDRSRFNDAYEVYLGRHPMEALHDINQPQLTDDWPELSRLAMYHLVLQHKTDDARAWIERLPDDSQLRDLMTVQLVKQWTLQSPDDAVNWLASVASENEFNEGLQAYFESLAGNRPQFAADLTQKFPDDGTREARLADVIGVWSKFDRKSADAWLSQQPPSPALDPAMARLAEAYAPDQPQLASDWAAKISDANLRAVTLDKIKKK